MGSADLDRLLTGAAEVIPDGGLREKLALGRPLRVKLGLDPTAADVTLGWSVVLRTLRRFQDAGHTAVLIVGDFTARVGDPSGKSETRPRQSKETVLGFAERLLDQFWAILDRDRAEVRYNSEWLEPLGMEGVLELTANYTVARMLERDDFGSGTSFNHLRTIHGGLRYLQSLDLTRARDVTIRQLLSHTSGYQDYWPQDYVMPGMLKPVTAEQILDGWARKPLDFEPGTKYQYSNTNYVIAGEIVRQASGKDLVAFLNALSDKGRAGKPTR